MTNELLGKKNGIVYSQIIKISHKLSNFFKFKYLIGLKLNFNGGEFYR